MENFPTAKPDHDRQPRPDLAEVSDMNGLAEALEHLAKRLNDMVSAWLGDFQSD